MPIDEVEIAYLHKVATKLARHSGKSCEFTVKPKTIHDDEYIMWHFIEVKRRARIVPDDRVCGYSTYIPPEFHFEILLSSSCFIPFMWILVVRKVKTSTKAVVCAPYLQKCFCGFNRIYFDAKRILENIYI